jgi:hypothetical protein
MKLVNPIKAVNLPLSWRQSISKSKFGKLTWKNFFIYPLTRWGWIYKKFESSLFDYLIVGSNPVLTELVLLDIYKLSLKTRQTYKIGIFFTDDYDYWAYHSLEQNDNWENIKNQTKSNLGKNFDDFCKQRNYIFEDKFLLDLTIINNNNIDISYYNKDENFTKGYIFKLKEKDKNKSENDYEKTMPNVSLAEKNIKNRYLNIFLKYAKNKNTSFLTYSDKFKSVKDSEEKIHLLLSQNVFLTSMCSWVNCTTTQVESTNSENETYQLTDFSHNLKDFSFGSATHIANDFISLEHQSIQDFTNLYLKVNSN